MTSGNGNVPAPAAEAQGPPRLRLDSWEISNKSICRSEPTLCPSPEYRDLRSSFLACTANRSQQILGEPIHHSQSAPWSFSFSFDVWMM